MERPGFKSGGWRHASPGGFDSHSLPPRPVTVATDPRAIDFPSGLLYLVGHDVWVRLHEDRSATVGITALGIKLSGEIYMCRAKPVGAIVEQGHAVAVVELAKAIVSVKSAVSGQVVEVNSRLDEMPELVHLDPSGEGWVARLATSNFERDRARLVEGDAMRAAMVAHVRSVGDSR